MRAGKLCITRMLSCLARPPSWTKPAIYGPACPVRIRSVVASLPDRTGDPKSFSANAPAVFADLPAMKQDVVQQHAGHHRLTHRNSADADAWVVAAFGDDLGR